MNKTVAERLRKLASDSNSGFGRGCNVLADLGGYNCDKHSDCGNCTEYAIRAIADMVEAEQAELRAENERLCRDFYEPCARMGFTEHAHGIEVVFDAMSRAAQGHECRVDFKALDLLCEKLEMSSEHSGIAAQIRKAMNGVERSNDGVDVGSLLKLANKFDGYSTVPSYESFIFKPQDFNIWSKKIRDAVKGAKPQLPEGIEWPRDKNGDFIDLRVMYTHGYGALERVTFFPTPEGIKSFVMSHDGMYVECDKCEPCQPEVLDADGVPIKVGDTVYHEVDGSELTVVGFRDEKEDGEVMVDVEGKWFCVRQFSLTHRKPDTFKSVVEEMLADFDSHDTIELDGYFARLRVLMGGE